MALSILTYSLVTGLAYFAQSPEHLGAIRFISALGMGGQWSLGVALVMECWPEKWRPMLAGAMGAAANVGFLLVGFTARLQQVTPESWRWMMLVAALPAFFVVFIMVFAPESERWKQSVQKSTGGSPVKAVFSPGLRKTTILGIIFASVVLIGTWASVQWLPAWADQLTGGKLHNAKGLTQALIAAGAVTGCFIGPWIGGRMGRRPAYFILNCPLSATSNIMKPRQW